MGWVIVEGEREGFNLERGILVWGIVWLFSAGLL